MTPFARPVQDQLSRVGSAELVTATVLSMVYPRNVESISKSSGVRMGAVFEVLGRASV